MSESPARTETDAARCGRRLGGGGWFLAAMHDGDVEGMRSIVCLVGRAASSSPHFENVGSDSTARSSRTGMVPPHPWGAFSAPLRQKAPCNTAN